MQESDRVILVIGQGSPLMEGVSDLLQLAGYTILRSPSWAEAQHQLRFQPPGLAIADLSSPDSEAYLLAERMCDLPAWTDVPVLFVNLTQEDRVRGLQCDSGNGNGHRIRFYSNTLLGMNGLLEEVRSCLA